MKETVPGVYNLLRDPISKQKQCLMFKAKQTRPHLLTDRTFTTSEVSRIAQVSLRQLQWWDERKIVSPGREGHKRVYLPAEVLEVLVIAELRRKGFSLQGIRRVARFLKREGGHRLSQVLSGDPELHLLTDGKSIYLEDRPGRVIDLLKDAKQPMFLVCLSDQLKRFGPPPKKPIRTETLPATRKVRAG